jgi:putative transposase
MARYRRAKIAGGVFFFTVTLADRSSDLLIRQIERLRRVYRSVEERYPFDTIAICVLPDHSTPFGHYRKAMRIFLCAGT